MEILTAQIAFLLFIALAILIGSFYLADMSQKQNKDISYWGVFFISMFTSPITAYIVLHFTKTKKDIAELTDAEKSAKENDRRINEMNAKRFLLGIIIFIIASIVYFIATHQG